MPTRSALLLTSSWTLSSDALRPSVLAQQLKVTKLEIARREIDTSIDLYFNFGDLVSTHLLVSSAHEILSDYDRKILKTGMLFDHPEKFIKEEYLDESIPRQTQRRRSDR